MKHGDLLTRFVRKFWMRVDKTGNCWNWTGGIYQGTGYGQVSLRDQKYKAHRLAWEFTNGAVPDGVQVLHHCDNPRCVKPAHLFLGDHDANMLDMAQKGRGIALLTEEQVREVRTTPSTYGSGVALARRFKVSRQVINGIRRGKTYRWVS